jgi:hypothetical protein
VLHLLTPDELDVLRGMGARLLRIKRTRSRSESP